MAQEPAVSPAADHEERSSLPVSVGIGDPGRRLERLAPLLHELVTWDLIYRSEAGTFLLRDDVQQRLEEMSAIPQPATAQVYVGRKCEVCGLVRVTRLVNGSRTCTACSGSTGAAPPSIPGAGSDRHGQSGVHFRWHRKAVLPTRHPRPATG